MAAWVLVVSLYGRLRRLAHGRDDLWPDAFDAAIVIDDERTIGTEGEIAGMGVTMDGLELVDLRGDGAEQAMAHGVDGDLVITWRGDGMDVVASDVVEGEDAL